MPMHFDASLPLGQRSYRFQANHFEDFLAAHIYGPVETEARAVWASGGYIHFTGAIFFDCHIVAASMPELTAACFKVTDASPPGFTLVFEKSLFISGDVSETFFQLYDAGIHVKNSRWLRTRGSRPSFHVAKPKCAFGGNGNPLYVEGMKELNPNSTEDDFLWARALQGPTSTSGDSSSSHLVSFECLAWDSPYIEGSYVYSPDSFGTARAPTILAPDRAQRRPRRIVGQSSCSAYLQKNMPRFFCGNAFGTYGLWCGSGTDLEDCPGVTSDARSWYHALLPWSRMSTVAASATSVGTGQSMEPVEPVEPVEPSAPPNLGDLPAGDCTFPRHPPEATPFVWDPSCQGGGVGCNADGSHMECRWCGFGPYLPCPPASIASPTSAQAGASDGSGQLVRGIIWLVVMACLLSLLGVCWYTGCTGCTFRRRARATCISQIPTIPAVSPAPAAAEQAVPGLLGRTALPAKTPPLP